MSDVRLTWATVTSVSPLRVKIDGDTSNVPFTPDSLVDPLLLAVNDRVRCELSDRRLIIVGRSSGLGALGLRQIVTFASSGTFSKATYPWLRAIRVRVQGGGGGGGGCATTGAGQNAIGGSGAGGGYAESLLTDIAGLASSVTVTVGAGGSGGTAGANAGGNGGTSSFGSLVAATGGSGGLGGAAGTVGAGAAANSRAPGVGTTGAILLTGNASGYSLYANAAVVAAPSPGAGAVFGAVQEILVIGTGLNGFGALGRGSGGGGGVNAQSQGTARSGGAGTAGLIVVECYA